MECLKRLGNNSHTLHIRIYTYLFLWLKKMVPENDIDVLEVKGELGSEWLTIVIDEKIPCHAGTAQPRFAQANSREIWVLLMEKAFAKMYGGYDKLEGTCPDRM